MAEVEGVAPMALKMCKECRSRNNMDMRRVYCDDCVDHMVAQGRDDELPELEMSVRVARRKEERKTAAVQAPEPVAHVEQMQPDNLPKIFMCIGNVMYEATKVAGSGCNHKKTKAYDNMTGDLSNFCQDCGSPMSGKKRADDSRGQADSKGNQVSKGTKDLAPEGTRGSDADQRNTGLADLLERKVSGPGAKGTGKKSNKATATSHKKNKGK